jgi:hypothetical protein
MTVFDFVKQARQKCRIQRIEITPETLNTIEQRGSLRLLILDSSLSEGSGAFVQVKLMLGIQIARVGCLDVGLEAQSAA